MENTQLSNLDKPKLKINREDFMVNGIVVPEETETEILGLFGKYRALSNFHLASIIVDDITFRCSEGAYMAQKTNTLPEKYALCNMSGPEAKAYGQKVTLRPDWNEERNAAMYKVLWAKFTQHSDLKALLLSTGNKRIEETNWWRDKYWGVYAGEGSNQLGITLMAIRDQLWEHDEVSTEFLGH